MTGGVEDDLLVAAAYLSRVAEPGSVPISMFVQRVGYLEAAAAIRHGTAPTSVLLATESRRLTADGAVDLDAAVRNGIRLVTPLHEEWPHFSFASLSAATDRRIASWRAGARGRPEGGELLAPLALWLKGPLALDTVGVRSLAVVGSRAATTYGTAFATDVGYGVAQRGVTVVSGGAYGIDCAAHRGALAADGTPALVSAGGLDRPYPTGNTALYRRVAETGLLISEHPPGSAPHRRRFLSRNRLIAALGAATLVVEAAHRSGALNSARYARQLGRVVLAVPGPVSSVMSAGCHALIQRAEDPARLVTGVSEILAFCGSFGFADDPQAELQLSDYDRLEPCVQAVLDGFPARAVVDEATLASLAGQPLSAVLAALTVLRQLGMITAADEGYRLV